MQKSINVEINLPEVPQELWAVIADHDNQQVIRKKSPLFEFTDKELREIGKRWLENLLLEAAEQRGGR